MTVQLNKNLRRSLLQGSPWVYREALQAPANVKKAILCKLNDKKKQFIGWGLYDPHGPLAVRLLSLDKQAPDEEYFAGLLKKAWHLRQTIHSEKTNCYRFINGEGDLLPGLVCDIYADIAVIQFDGRGPYEFWDQNWLADWILENTHCRSVFLKPRRDFNVDPQFWGESLSSPLIQVRENDCSFYVDVKTGQKTGFFLDQRENRDYVKSISDCKTVLNLFCYTGGFSIQAGVGGAKHVTSVDLSRDILNMAQKNWDLNGLEPNRHQTQCEDVFESLHEYDEKYDIVICDPPSLAKSEKHKEPAIQKYVETFAAAAKRVSPNGHLILSSCSSHINFDDFNEITKAALSKSRKRAQVLRVSGQGPDHPYPHACPQLRYLKFVDLVVYE